MHKFSCISALIKKKNYVHFSQTHLKHSNYFVVSSQIVLPKGASKFIFRMFLVISYVYILNVFSLASEQDCPSHVWKLFKTQTTYSTMPAITSSAASNSLFADDWQRQKKQVSAAFSAATSFGIFLELRHIRTSCATHVAVRVSGRSARPVQRISPGGSELGPAAIQKIPHGVRLLAAGRRWRGRGAVDASTRACALRPAGGRHMYRTTPVHARARAWATPGPDGRGECASVPCCPRAAWTPVVPRDTSIYSSLRDFWMKRICVCARIGATPTI